LNPSTHLLLIEDDPAIARGLREGLGLAIVRAIVQEHNGQVIAENVGPGARFAIRPPIASPAKL